MSAWETVKRRWAWREIKDGKLKKKKTKKNQSPLADGFGTKWLELDKSTALASFHETGKLGDKAALQRGCAAWRRRRWRRRRGAGEMGPEAPGSKLGGRDRGCRLARGGLVWRGSRPRLLRFDRATKGKRSFQIVQLQSPHFQSRFWKPAVLASAV